MTTRLISTPNGFVDPADIDFSAAPASGPAAPLGSENRVHYGPIKLSMSPGGEVTSAGRASHASAPGAGLVGGSIAATLNSTFGKPSVELIPGDPSSRTLVESAARDGVIRMNAAGHWEDVHRTAAPTEAEKAKSASDELAETNQDTEDADGTAAIDTSLREAAIDHEDESLWAQDIEPLSQPGYDRAAAGVVNLVAHGKGSVEAIAAALVRDEGNGMDMSLGTDFVVQGIAMGQRMVDRAMNRLGLSGDALQAFYVDVLTQPTKAQDAIQKLHHSRDLSGFREMAVAYKVRNTDLSAYRNAGLQAAVDPTTGDVLIQHGNGPWVKASSLK